MAVILYQTQVFLPIFKSDPRLDIQINMHCHCGADTLPR